MNIAVYVPTTSLKYKFIVETFFPLFQNLISHHVAIITDVSTAPEPHPDVEIITVKPQPSNPLLKKIWVSKTLTQALRRTRCDIFISADFGLSTAGVAQCILVTDPEKIKPAHAKKAELLIVLSESSKNELVKKLNINKNKIVVVYPSPGKLYSLIDEKRKESIKEKYTGGKEYFLFSGDFQQANELIDLLKSFSHFKKRQRSSFKLLLLTEPGFAFEKTIENYKYREDIIIITSADSGDKAAIMGAAFAVVLPFNAYEDMSTALNAMQSGAPLIIPRDSYTSEIASDTVLYAQGEIKDIGEKMMQLYKDEDLRSRLIKNAKEIVKNFSVQKSADQLLQSITKLPN
jgi:glycosyltransferase involved in cell wall biosynthesis